jgi:hypothetical protein
LRVLTVFRWRPSDSRQQNTIRRDDDIGPFGRQTFYLAALGQRHER